MLLIFPLRKNAGGYHAETKSRCLLYSSAILFVSVICFVQVEWLDLGYILVAGFFFAIIFLLAPVENDNKRLELVEYRVYRKRARIILLPKLPEKIITTPLTLLVVPEKPPEICRFLQ